MRRFVLLATVLCALPLAADVAAKEMPAVTISKPPAKLRPHMVWRATLTYTIDGQPADLQGWKPYVQIQKESGTAIRIFNAVPTKQTGVFRARVVFPSSGRWVYDVGDASGLHDGVKGQVLLLRCRRG
jgi:hypothetical protein